MKYLTSKCLSEFLYKMKSPRPIKSNDLEKTCYNNNGNDDDDENRRYFQVQRISKLSQGAENRERKCSMRLKIQSAWQLVVSFTKVGPFLLLLS